MNYLIEGIGDFDLCWTVPLGLGGGGGWSWCEEWGRELEQKKVFTRGSATNPFIENYGDLQNYGGSPKGMKLYNIFHASSGSQF
jgi:hypothetical protein